MSIRKIRKTETDKGMEREKDATHRKVIIKHTGHQEKECSVVAIVGSAGGCHSSASDIGGTGFEASFAADRIPAFVELVLALASSAAGEYNTAEASAAVHL